MTELKREIAHLRELRAKHQKNIRTLEETLASYGMDRPLKLVNELEFEQEQLRRVEERLEELLGPSASPLSSKRTEDFSEMRQAYFDYLIQEYKDHVIRGFAPQVGGRVISLPLSKIFLPLQALEGRPHLAQYAEEDLLRQAAPEAMGELDWQYHLQEMEKRYAQLRARQAIQRSLSLVDLLKAPRAVLLGDPGTGKTTMTRYITYALAANDYSHIGDSVRGLIPVLTRIANYGRALERDSTMHLIEYVERELTPRPDLGRYLRRAIEAGQCLIILDGLDEVADPSLRIRVTERIQKMVAGFSDNRFLVTSRIIGYDQSPLTREFKQATLQELTEADKERFVRLWYAAIESEVSGSITADGAESLIEALRAKPQIARMAANPLLLTIMVLMHWRGIKLPNRRVQVYQNATDTLVEYWTTQRGVGDLDAEEIKAILAPIAYYILSSNVSGVIAHHDLIPRFCRGIAAQRGCHSKEARRIGRELLKALGEQSGLFLKRGLDADSQPVYGFLHQTFGEYLAALHLAEEVFSGAFNLADYIHHSMWHEPLLLLMGHLSLVSQTHANILLRDILAFPAPYEEVLQRNLFLAAGCLADDVQVSPPLRDEILQKLTRALQHEASQVRETALVRYKNLAVTRHREAAAVILKKAVDDLDDLERVEPQVRLSLATALLYLGERDVAQSILWPLEDTKYERTPIKQQRVRRLHFEYWPEQATDYLLQLQADKDYLYVSADSDLSRSDIGPVNADLARRVLGETGFYALIEALISRMKDKDDQAVLRWIAALAKDPPSIEEMANLTAPDNPPQVRRLAASQLLDSSERAAAISALRNLAEQEPDQAPAAAQALLEAGEVADLDWQLLRDTALIVDDSNVPQAINTLLQAGDVAIALPVALHLLATGRPERGADREVRLWPVVESLIGHSQTRVGLAAARWLALRPGYYFRVQACEALWEAGQIEETIPLLQFLAHECHDEASQRACQRLLILKEAERVAPLLMRVAHLAEADMRYHACLALALANYPSADDGSGVPERSELKVAILDDHSQAYQTALSEFCRVGLETLEAYQPVDDQARSAQALGRLSLHWLANSFTVPDQADKLDELLNDPWPAISLNAALFELRAGRVGRAHSRLVAILTETDQTLSIPIYLKAIATLGQIVDSESTKLLIQAVQHEKSQVRRAAARALGPLGDPIALQPLLVALRDEDSGARKAAATSLGELGDPAAVQPLINALNDENAIVRSWIARALGALGDRTAVQPLIAALSDKDSLVRIPAVNSLGRLGDAAAVQPLIAALSDEDGLVRCLAAYALERLDDCAAVQPLIAALSDEDKDVREAVASALGKLGDHTLTPTLVNALTADNNNVRESAARTLGWLGDSAALHTLFSALGDQVGNVREAAAEALGRLKESTAIEPLTAALSDKEGTVRGAAARALGELGHSSSIHLLLNILGDESNTARSDAAYALGQLGNLIAVQHLIAALSDETTKVRWTVAMALGQLGDPAAVQPLIIALSDERACVPEAAEALGKLGNLAVIQPLIAALIDQDSYIRSLAAEALGRLGVTEAAPIIAATSVPEDDSEAFKYATALIHLDPPSALSVLNRYALQFRQESGVDRLRGQALWQLNEMDEALASLKRALDKEYCSLNVLALAHFHLEQAEFQTAKEYVDQAVEIAPRRSVCVWSQAVVLWYLGEISEALEKLKLAQRMDRSVKLKDLQYGYFWREKAITALEAMLAELETQPM